jgi:hypothetical protein
MYTMYYILAVTGWQYEAEVWQWAVSESQLSQQPAVRLISESDTESLSQ